MCTMPKDPHQHIDVISSAEGDYHTAKPPRKRPARRWVGVRFDCCGVYTRIYRRPQARAYRGRCPRCRRLVTLRVAAHGVQARIFRATPT